MIANRMNVDAVNSKCYKFVRSINVPEIDTDIVKLHPVFERNVVELEIRGRGR